MIYDPRVGEHRDISDMALNIDVTATILDLAGIDIPAGYHGKSLMPIVNGETDTLARDTVLIEHLWDMEDIPASEGVRTTEWKYFRYVSDPSIEELYYLPADPEETNNLASYTEYQVMLESLRARFRQLAGRFEAAPVE
jgi:arylsulfatase A-like enzyme